MIEGRDGAFEARLIRIGGRIPAEQIDSPTLAAVLARSVVGDLECAYNNYFTASAVHSDEFETSNSNVPGANWGERSISAPPVRRIGAHR